MASGSRASAAPVASRSSPSWDFWRVRSWRALSWRALSSASMSRGRRGAMGAGPPQSVTGSAAALLGSRPVPEERCHRETALHTPQRERHRGAAIRRQWEKPGEVTRISRSSRPATAAKPRRGTRGWRSRQRSDGSRHRRAPRPARSRRLTAGRARRGRERSALRRGALARARGTTRGRRGRRRRVAAAGADHQGRIAAPGEVQEGTCVGERCLRCDAGSTAVVGGIVRPEGEHHPAIAGHEIKAGGYFGGEAAEDQLACVPPDTEVVAGQGNVPGASCAADAPNPAEGFVVSRAVHEAIADEADPQVPHGMRLRHDCMPGQEAVPARLARGARQLEPECGEKVSMCLWKRRR